jgi:GTPase SAR1 family protein
MANTFEFEEMARSQSKLSVAVYGPSGSGKTTAALKLAQGIRDQLYPGEDLTKIGLFIDTERRSSTKAVGRRVGGETLEPLELYAFEPPFDIYKLADLIEYAVAKGKKIIVTDSYTAFWSGSQGILENAAELEVQLADSKKMYGAWSEKEIISKKNVLKNIMTNAQAHIIMCFRAKTEYVMEANSRGKMQPRAVGLKEDMQSDVRYEFDVVLSIDKESHNVTIVKDRIGYEEVKLTEDNPEAPFTVADGRTLAKLVSEGLTLEELATRKREKSINFILDEKRHKSSKVAQFEAAKKVELTREYLEALPNDNLIALVKFLN